MGKGAVKDLAEKLRKGKITSDEARRELRKRGRGHEEEWKDFIGDPTSSKNIWPKPFSILQ